MSIKGKNNKVFTGNITKEAQDQIKTLPYHKAIVIFAVLNILTTLFIILLQKFLPPEIPLNYGLANKEEQLALSSFLVIPNISSLAIMTINILLCMVIKDDFFRKALIITGCVAIAFSIITTLKIFFLVGSF